MAPSRRDSKAFNVRSNREKQGLEVEGFETIYRIWSVDKIGRKSVVPIVPSGTPNKFYALFDQDEVDFEIQVDNKACISRSTSFILDVHKTTQCILTRRLESVELETTCTKGNKFHFLGRSRELAQSFVGRFAYEHGLDFGQAAAIVGRIGFRQIKYSMPLFQIFVRDIDGKLFSLDVSELATVLQVKREIESMKGIPSDDQRLVHSGKELQDGKTMKHCRILKGSTIQVLLRILGGKPLMFCESQTKFINKDCFGEPGVIVPGAKSMQRFAKAFIDVDDNIKVKDFVVELRLAPKRSLSSD